MDTVTLDKAYFETLLRKAQFHADGHDFSTPLNIPTVTIPKSDHDTLLESARQYANLRRNLYRGGIVDDTLAVLIQDDTTPNGNGNGTSAAPVMNVGNMGLFNETPFNDNNQTSGDQHYTYGRTDGYTPQSDNRHREDSYNDYQHHTNNDGYDFMPEGPNDFYDENPGRNGAKDRPQRQQYEKSAKRSVVLANLPENTTHADIAEVVRGGMLLDLFVRTHDRTANVSFLEGSAAQDFFSFVKRHDLYIKGKRVEIRWNERQFQLPGHVANKISIGATRNLVIYNCSPKHTEEKIRDHLEHIHNLVVISVAFKGQNAHISTNSVHNAMFARTCMMSRAIYKGSKIEWDQDDCAQPIVRPLHPGMNNVPAPKKKSAPPMNRFQLLNMEDGETESQIDDDEENDSSGVTLPSFLKA